MGFNLSLNTEISWLLALELKTLLVVAVISLADFTTKDRKHSTQKMGIVFLMVFIKKEGWAETWAGNRTVA